MTKNVTDIAKSTRIYAPTTPTHPLNTVSNTSSAPENDTATGLMGRALNCNRTYL